MYSARVVNDSSYDHAEKPLRISNQLYATESILPGMGGVLSTREPDFDVTNRIAWIFISIKNRSFNRAYINGFIDLCEKVGIEGRICAVDAPYEYNAMAELGVETLAPSDAAKIHNLSGDFQRMVAKAIRGKRSERVQLVQWATLEEDTPQAYRDELAHAFYGHTAVRDALFEHVSSVKPVTDDIQFERFAKFFLCEVPVLLHAYYAYGATMDIYPGPQPSFFWQIELGEFANELPKLTALTQSGRPMLFLDTHNRRVAKR